MEIGNCHCCLVSINIYAEELSFRISIYKIFSSICQSFKVLFSSLTVSIYRYFKYLCRCSHCSILLILIQLKGEFVATCKMRVLMQYSFTVLA